MPKQKQHPLLVDALQDENAFYTMGHHPLDLFAATVRRLYSHEIDPTKCRHVLMRYNPVAPTQEGYGYYKQTVAIVKEPGRGVFPATVYEIW